MSKKLDELLTRRQEIEDELLYIAHTDIADVENIDFSEQLKSVDQEINTHLKSNVIEINGMKISKKGDALRTLICSYDLGSKYVKLIQHETTLYYRVYKRQLPESKYFAEINQEEKINNYHPVVFVPIDSMKETKELVVISGSRNVKDCIRSLNGVPLYPGYEHEFPCGTFVAIISVDPFPSYISSETTITSSIYFFAFLTILDRAEIIYKQLSSGIHIKRTIDHAPTVDTYKKTKTTHHDYPSYTMEDLQNDTYIDADELDKYQEAILDRKQVIFYGSPGTGKTFLAQKLAKYIVGGDESRISLIQFHPSYLYEDFVQGYRPTESNQFTLKEGPIIKLYQKAKELQKIQKEGKEEYVVLIIDELNRGNVPKIFGELFLLLEYRDIPVNLVHSSDSSEPFRLPDNLIILATMNVTDSSLVKLDMALQRRFFFISVEMNKEPFNSVLNKWIKQLKDGDLEYLTKIFVDQEWISNVNKILAKYNNPIRIGTSHFINRKTAAEVIRSWNYCLKPMIEQCMIGIDSEKEMVKKLNEYASLLKKDDKNSVHLF